MALTTGSKGHTKKQNKHKQKKQQQNNNNKPPQNNHQPNNWRELLLDNTGTSSTYAITMSASKYISHSNQMEESTDWPTMQLNSEVSGVWTNLNTIIVGMLLRTP